MDKLIHQINKRINHLWDSLEENKVKERADLAGTTSNKIFNDTLEEKLGLWETIGCA